VAHDFGRMPFPLKVHSFQAEVGCDQKVSTGRSSQHGAVIPDAGEDAARTRQRSHLLANPPDQSFFCERQSVTNIYVSARAGAAWIAKSGGNQGQKAPRGPSSHTLQAAQGSSLCIQCTFSAPGPCMQGRKARSCRGLPGCLKVTRPAVPRLVTTLSNQAEGWPGVDTGNLLCYGL
jgi:hypothetical protein